MPQTDFDTLGQFYLGKVFDPGSRTRSDDLVLYDSKDLVTHAVCVGMTGSGKTGLCIGLLEEAALDGIPAIVIDPKGDLANLLLTFPDLRPEDFLPWINEDDARRKGLSPDQHAAAQASLWARGLSEWGQDGARVARLRASAEFAVYTPGSNAATPVSILRSFAAPEPEIVEDGELFRERVGTTATSVLGLLKINADPLQSREHILLSAVIADAWARGEDLDLGVLIRRIQQPPFTKLGVMEVETVFPASERFALAMALNNLLASPGFAAWMQGEPLDIQRMLYTPQGRPRVAIFSVAHLGDAERMFFVSLLLNQVLGWVRTQRGTTSLRAIVYMDEIAGYFPPVANPPSKQPLLTLMKQARAFGVGVVLATQNPVDLDYKGLANAGTWFIGRLQTDRDKQRVLDGLEGAMANASHAFDRAETDRLLSSLSQRVFLMNNVHEDAPVVFETRWVMSYLRGPMTRQELRRLSTGASTPAAGAGAPPASPLHPAPRAAASTTSEPSAPSATTVAAATAPARSVTHPAASSSTSTRPILPPEIPQFFVLPRAGLDAAQTVHFRPMLLTLGKVYYQDARSAIDTEVPAGLLVPMGAGPVVVDWDHARATDLTDKHVTPEPGGWTATGATFAPLPVAAGKARSYDEWKKAFADALYRTHRLELRRSPALRVTSAPGEDEGAFRARLAQAARERRDAEVERLRHAYAPKLQTLQERRRRAEQTLEKQREQSRGAKFGTAVSVGAAIFGAVLGRKSASTRNVGRAATAARSAGRAAQESQDVGRAEETLAAVDAQLADLRTRFDADVAALSTELAAAQAEVDVLTLKPKKANVSVRAVLLVWAPHSQSGEPLWNDRTAADRPAGARA